MGTGIDQEEFDERDYPRFRERLEECLSALAQLLERPGFGAGPATIGAELELFLVDGTRARCGAGTGPSTILRRTDICGSRCGPCRQVPP